MAAKKAKGSMTHGHTHAFMVSVTTVTPVTASQALAIVRTGLATQAAIRQVSVRSVKEA